MPDWGQGSLEHFVMAGARVAAIARRKTDLDDEATSTGRLLSLTADLSQTNQVLEASRACLDAFDGRVDILVNNAASLAGGVKAEDETYEDIRRTLAVNLEAPILLGQAFFPGMHAAGAGSIINITSITASVGIGRFPQAVYASSKGGLEALTRGNRPLSRVDTAFASTAWLPGSSRPR